MTGQERQQQIGAGHDCPSCGRGEITWYCPTCGYQGDPVPGLESDPLFAVARKFALMEAERDALAARLSGLQDTERALANAETLLASANADVERFKAWGEGLQDTLAKLDKATTALRMIEENEHGESWSAGVAMSALSAMEEVGYPKPHPRPDLFGPYTMGVKLCDDDGIVRSGRFHSGTDYPCTGHAHFAGEHIECTSPAHRAALALNTDGPRPCEACGSTDLGRPCRDTADGYHVHSPALNTDGEATER